MPQDQFPVTDRSRVRRRPDRARYDRETVFPILDAALIGHVGVVIDGRPSIVPMLIARDGEALLLHGSPASRTMRALAAGAEACVSVALIDGLVLARSAFHHSANYRSVICYGRAEEIRNPEAKEQALARFTEKLVPGRSASLRPMLPKEVKGTMILRLPIEEVSAKVRTGGPSDDEEDYELPIWAGVLPLRTVAGEPLPDSRNLGHVEVPGHVLEMMAEWQAGGARA
jgi:hypothetical protein